MRSITTAMHLVFVGTLFVGALLFAGRDGRTAQSVQELAGIWEARVRFGPGVDGTARSDRSSSR